MKTRMGRPPPTPAKKRKDIYMKYRAAADDDSAHPKKFRKVMFSNQGGHENHCVIAKTLPHPLYSSFQDTIDGYRSGAAATRSQLLQDTFHTLSKKLDGIDGDEKDTKSLGLPREDDIETLELATKTLTLPFEEETMTHKKSHPDGTKGLVDIKLGDSMRTFATEIAQMRSELDRLMSALNETRVQIRFARNDIMHAEDPEGKGASAELQKELRTICKDAESAKDLTLSEVSSGRNEDQLLKAEATRKFQELVNAFSQ